MLNKEIYKLKIDEDFKRLIPPLSAEERKQLEKNIIQDGCRDALVVWEKTIIDGYNRYEICSRREIPFAIERITLGSREEAIAWICANQLGRRNISEETRRYLIGKRYEMEKAMRIFNTTGKNQHTRNEVGAQIGHQPKLYETATKTSERLGREYRLGCNTVRRFGAYAQAIDRIAKEAPEFHEKILSGQLRITQEKILELGRLSPPEIQRIEAELPADPSELTRYMDAMGLIPRNMPNKVQLAQMNVGAIKEIPAYDPDAEILSLAFTVPSWVSSINRVRTTAKFSEISDKAREKIKAALDELDAAIRTIRDAIQGEK